MFSAFLNEQSCYLHSTQKKNRQNLTPKNREREKMGSGEDGGMDRWRDGQKDGGMDRWTEGWIDGKISDQASKVLWWNLGIGCSPCFFRTFLCC